MFFVTRNADELTVKRLDANYYSPEFVANQKLVEKFKTVSLDSLRKKDAPIVYGILKPEGGSNGKYRVVKAENFEDMFVDPNKCEEVSKKIYDEFLRSTAIAGDLLVAIGGYVGRPAILQSASQVSANINRHLARLRVDNSIIDSHFLVAVLSCSNGQLILNRQITGTVQAGINLEDLREVAVPVVNSMIQKYIGNKVRQAERLRTLGKKLSEKLDGAIETIFAGNPRPLKAHRSHVSKDMLLEKRLDAEFYSPESLWAESEITKSKYGFAPLGNLATRIKDGPGGWGVSTNDYQESGVPVIRSVNIVDGECDLSDCVYISEKKHQDLISHEAKRGCVLLSVRGTIGRAAVFNDRQYRVASLNAAVVTIDCKDEINPYFLAAFLNSPIGKIQANRIANGAVQLNMNLTETASNLVVTPPQTIQDEIAEIYKAKIDAKNASKQLTTIAKLLVEALIEGQLTEAELSAAEQALQAGNDQLDRRILNRLKTDGIDGQGPALFGDLDELYHLLTQAKED